MSGKKPLTLKELHKIREAYRHFQSTSDFIRVIDELIAVREAQPITVKLKKHSVGEVMHMSGFSREYAEGWCAGNDNAIHEVKLAGVAVETNGCGHSSAFWDVSGVKRCSLCEVAVAAIESMGGRTNG